MKISPRGDEWKPIADMHEFDRLFARLHPGPAREDDDGVQRARRARERAAFEALLEAEGDEQETRRPT